MLYLEIVAAMVLLVIGASALLRGSTRLAARFGVSRLLIGLTVVAFGTSAPELAVSLGAALHGGADLAVGNVVGSNLFNVLLILGLSALVAPMPIARKLVRLDIPLLVAVSLVMVVMAADGSIGRFDGLLLFGGCLAYTVFSVRIARREADPNDRVDPATLGGSSVRDVVWTVLGLGTLVLGADWLVASATELARALGVSELVIGLTIVAAGTSLPEAATSVVAALRGERDVAIGNVVGSNLMNVLLILGLCGLVSPAGLRVAPAVQHFDLPVMLAATFATVPIAIARGRIARWEGALFLAGYVLYTLYLVLHAKDSPSLPLFREVVMGYVLPALAIALTVLLARGLQRRREEDPDPAPAAAPRRPA